MKETLETNFINPKTPLEHKIAGMGPWFHNLHLPDGTQTAPNHPLGDFPFFKWIEIAPFLGNNLKGLTALDIGCNAGFYSFELARLGAKVTGIDIDGHYLKQAGWAAEKFGLADRVSFKQLEIYDLARESQIYDIVLFMGVFYHLRYPLLALDIIADKFSKLLVFQTLTMPDDGVVIPPEDMRIEDREIMQLPGYPKMAFIEKSLAGDPTNWWAPNHAAVEAMLRSCGLKIIERPSHEVYVCTKDESLISYRKEEKMAALKNL